MEIGSVDIWKINALVSRIKKALFLSISIKYKINN